MQISVDGVPSPHKTKKAGRRRISAPPASRFSLDSKAFPLAKLKSPQSIVSSTEDFRGRGGHFRCPLQTVYPDSSSEFLFSNRLNALSVISSLWYMLVSNSSIILMSS